MPAIFGLKAEYRPYRCANCGNVQQVSTNHTDACINYCAGCSWKPSWRGDGRYGDKNRPEMAFPFNGRTYRPFVYAGE